MDVKDIIRLYVFFNTSCYTSQTRRPSFKGKYSYQLDAVANLYYSHTFSRVEQQISLEFMAEGTFGCNVNAGSPKLDRTVYEDLRQNTFPESIIRSNFTSSSFFHLGQYAIITISNPNHTPRGEHEIKA